MPGSRSDATPGPPQPAPGRQPAAPLRHPVATAVAVFAAARLLMLAALVVAAAVHHPPGAGLGATLGAGLGKSDGVWYLGIAHHGYGPPPPIGPDGSYVRLTSLAFFPLYPMLVRAVAVTGLPYLGAALLVTGVAGLAAAGLVAAWARPLVGDRGAVGLVGIWSLLPSAVVFDLAYSEALFAAFAAACLLALQRRRWLLAGLAAAAGGLTRPTGGALVLAVAVTAGLELRGLRAREPAAWRTAWRPLTATVLAAGGLLAALGHVAAATGRWDGWFWLESTVWRSGFDGGRSALTHLGQIVTGGRAAHRLPEIVAGAVTLVVVALAVAVVVRAARRSRPGPAAGDLAYSLSAAALAVGERGYFYVKPRLLLVAFPLLVPLARRVGALGSRRLALYAAPAVVASLAYNAYLVIGWPKAL